MRVLRGRRRAGALGCGAGQGREERSRHHGQAQGGAEALRRLGADVTVINDDYCGTDINVQCGSTHLEPLRALVAECGADVGIAHDGDADRVMLMDSEGNEIDGDMVEAVCALVARMLSAGGELVTVLFGDEYDEAATESVLSRLRSAHPDIEVVGYAAGPGRALAHVGVE